MTDTPDYTQEEVFDFLNDLRESGATNMWGAAPYIQEYFGVDSQTAKKLLLDWIDSF